MEFFDTHNHLDIDIFTESFDSLLHLAREVGVVGQILAGVRQAGWGRMLQLAAQHSDLHAAPGLHPIYLSEHHPGHLNQLQELLQQKEVVALGEIGLDYHLAALDRNRQQELFEAQVSLAKQMHLPLLLHIRKAHDQVLATLRRKHFPFGGIVHAYSGSLQQARQFIDLGFVIGVGGTITYSRATRVRKIACELPLDQLVLETDAPDIPVASHRHGPNQVHYLPEIAQCLAELRGEPVARIAEVTTANARRILRLDRT
jgi:TatD DNase family protein